MEGSGLAALAALAQAVTLTAAAVAPPTAMVALEAGVLAGQMELVRLALIPVRAVATAVAAVAGRERLVLLEPLHQGFLVVLVARVVREGLGQVRVRLVSLRAVRVALEPQPRVLAAVVAVASRQPVRRALGASEQQELSLMLRTALVAAAAAVAVIQAAWELLAVKAAMVRFMAAAARAAVMQRRPLAMAATVPTASSLLPIRRRRREGPLWRLESCSGTVCQRWK